MMAIGRVLVVEDDDALRETLAEALADEGHDVRVARDGAAALDRLREWSPHVILLDLMMPRMDGYAFRAAQRALPEASAAKVVIVSAARDAEHAASQLAADAWLAKPFGLDEVLHSVAGLMDGGTDRAA
jgi:CheY-like chemotaxis protein